MCFSTFHVNCSNNNIFFFLKKPYNRVVWYDDDKRRKIKREKCGNCAVPSHYAYKYTYLRLRSNNA